MPPPVGRLAASSNHYAVLVLSLVTVSAIVFPVVDGGEEVARSVDAGGSFNRYYNDVVQRDDLRSTISRQLPKQGKFFEEFDRSEYSHFEIEMLSPCR